MDRNNDAAMPSYHSHQSRVPLFSVVMGPKYFPLGANVLHEAPCIPDEEEANLVEIPS